MKTMFVSRYPSTADLKKKAKRRMPRFAFEYLEGGCNEDVNLHRNETDLQRVQLKPHYLEPQVNVKLETKLFGKIYSAPFGIAPVGLQGLMWPGAPEILARAAFEHNIPFILSTVTTASIERIAEITEGAAWFQLYHPAKNELRDKLIQRAADAQLQVLVALADVPSFGYRPRDIRNGLSMPPKFTVNNFLQVVKRPLWGIETLRHGIPAFKTLSPYMPKGLNMSQLGAFMNETFAGKLDVEKLKPIRDMWKGALVVKGIVNEADAEKVFQLGVDGIIVSNHGGRQIDAGESTIASLQRLSSFQGKMKIMIDSGLRSGPDIARCLAHKADFTFMGRPFMYGVGALGSKGGHHTITMFKKQLVQVMEQLGCGATNEVNKYLID